MNEICKSAWPVGQFSDILYKQIKSHKRYFVHLPRSPNRDICTKFGARARTRTNVLPSVQKLQFCSPILPFKTEKSVDG